MLRYFQKKSKIGESSLVNHNEQHETIILERSPSLPNNHSSEENCELPILVGDPGLRTSITNFEPKIREKVRREYYLRRACQPRKHIFKQRNFSGTMRRFNPSWFDEFEWLEYSIEKDAAYCLCCYLFKNECGKQGGGDAFVSEGFTNWKKKIKFREHEGGPNSAHNQALSKCRDLLNQQQHIETNFARMTEEAKINYRIRLNASIKCSRFLLNHGLPFRGHDESEDSSNRGLFIELLQFLSDNNEEVRNVVLKNAPENMKLIAPSIQKDIIRAAAFETTNAIIKELGNGFFSILIDEARDISTKEQMAVVLRFINKNGCVVERLLGLKHVANTTAKSLKEALDDLFSTHGLSISMLRGQGYDGASNMQGEYNGLKALILEENDCAHYIHCFAHQLQLALVAVAKKHVLVVGLFHLISNIVNVVGSSCKRHDIMRESQVVKIIEALSNEEITSGRGLNQETTLVRPCDTRWGSHYRTLISLTSLFGAVVDVLDAVVEDGLYVDKKFEASRLLEGIQSFEFIISLHLMTLILGITNELSRALQRKDQDIENAMRLVDISKKRLQMLRDDGWNALVKEVSAFCRKHFISIPNMNDLYVIRGRSRRKAEETTNFHHYRVELFNTVIDMQLQELNNRFNEANTELLLCVACLNPSDSFLAFDNQKLIRLAQFYPKDFSTIDILALSNQLETFIIDVRTNVDSSYLKGLSDVTQLMVKSKRNLTYPLVYKLFILALILPVATATVERAFSGMKIVKNRLRNRMCDQWLNDSLVVYIEKDVFNNLSDDVVMNYFQKMKNRKGQL